jgi:hypothetical protein
LEKENLSRSDSGQQIGINVLRNRWLNMAISGIPYLGGPFQVYLADVVAQSDKKRWESFWNDLESRLSRLESRALPDASSVSEELALRLRRVYGEVVGASDEGKLEYLREYFLACLIQPKADVTWKDVVFCHLRDLTGTHVNVLANFYELQKGLSTRDRFELPTRIENSPIPMQCLSGELRSLRVELLEVLIADLCARGLLAHWMGAPAEPRGWSITNSGVRFMEFLSTGAI